MALRAEVSTHDPPLQTYAFAFLGPVNTARIPACGGQEAHGRKFTRTCHKNAGSWMVVWGHDQHIDGCPRGGPLGGLKQLERAPMSGLSGAASC